MRRSRPLILVVGASAGAVPAALPFSPLDPAEYDLFDHRGVPDPIAAARALRPRVILVDVGPSPAPGIDLCRALTADPETRGVPLIAITGDAMIGRLLMTIRVTLCDTKNLRAEIERILLLDTSATADPTGT